MLGHEVAHLDLRQCIESLQYVLAVDRIGAGQLSQMAVSILHRFFSMGYRKYQESEADSYGLRLVVNAGDDPKQIVKVFE